MLAFEDTIPGRSDRESQSSDLQPRFLANCRSTSSAEFDLQLKDGGWKSFDLSSTDRDPVIFSSRPMCLTGRKALSFTSITPEIGSLATVKCWKKLSWKIRSRYRSHLLAAAHSYTYAYLSEISLALACCSHLHLGAGTVRSSCS